MKVNCYWYHFSCTFKNILQTYEAIKFLASLKDQEIQFIMVTDLSKFPFSALLPLIENKIYLLHATSLSEVEASDDEYVLIDGVDKNSVLNVLKNFGGNLVYHEDVGLDLSFASWKEIVEVGTEIMKDRNVNIVPSITVPVNSEILKDFMKECNQEFEEDLPYNNMVTMLEIILEKTLQGLGPFVPVSIVREEMKGKITSDTDKTPPKKLKANRMKKYFEKMAACGIVKAGDETKEAADQMYAITAKGYCVLSKCRGLKDVNVTDDLKPLLYAYYDSGANKENLLKYLRCFIGNYADKYVQMGKKEGLFEETHGELRLLVV